MFQVIYSKKGKSKIQEKFSRLIDTQKYMVYNKVTSLVCFILRFYTCVKLHYSKTSLFACCLDFTFYTCVKLHRYKAILKNRIKKQKIKPS